MTEPTLLAGRKGEMVTLRLIPGLRDRIADAAAASGRSANAEYNVRLEASFGEQPVVASPRLVPKTVSELLTEEEFFELEEAARQNTRTLEQEILHRARMSLRTQA